MRTFNGFSGQRVFVTGASGFIGSHLLNRLTDSGADVHAVSRALRPVTLNGACWYQGDLAETSTVRNLLRSIRPDIIFHLASHVAGARSTDLVMPTFHNNLMTTVNLLTVASEIGCRRFIQAGSLEEPEPDTPGVAPCSPYAAAKWASSGYARMFHELYQLPIVILRIFMVYGPAQNDLRKLIPYVILSLLRGESPQLSSGERQVDWVYREDVVEALIAASVAPNIEGSTIDVGSGELVRIRTLVEHLADIIKPRVAPIFGALAERPFEQVRVADTMKSHAMMGWLPTTRLDKGLRETVDWYGRQLRHGAL